LSDGSLLFLYDIDSKELVDLISDNKNIKTTGSRMDIKVSEDGNFISYINNNNIFLLELSTLSEYQVTNTKNDGILSGIFNFKFKGVAEFIIQEGKIILLISEFSR
jgi:hypothetical protein